MIFVRYMASAHQKPHLEADQLDPINPTAVYGEQTRDITAIGVV